MRIIVPALLCVLVALAVAVVWYYRASPSLGSPTMERHEDNSGGAPSLSEATRRILSHLNSPVEIRFYSSLKEAARHDELPAFAHRVELLLSQYEQAAAGKIRVIQRDPGTDADARAAAAADGVKPWIMDGGGSCYLGLAVGTGYRTEPLPQLAPEWEAALESDVTRAIVRATRTPVLRQQTEAQSEAASAALREVESLITNLASVSVEEGTKILRESALQDFIATVKATEPQIEAIQQRMREIEGTVSDAQRKSLLEQLHQLRTEQKEKLDEIAVRVEAQVTALKQLKGVSEQPATVTEERSPTRPTR